MPASIPDPTATTDEASPERPARRRKGGKAPGYARTLSALVIVLILIDALLAS